MVAPKISGVPLRSSEIKQLNKNHRTVVFTVSVILPFEVLIRLIYNVFHSLASSANLRRICISCFANYNDFRLLLNWQARQTWIQPCQKLLANRSRFHLFTFFVSRASGYPLLQKPHFQIMPIYNSFIIFLIGFLPLVGEFLPQTPDKNRRENLKIFSPSGARWA